MFAADLKLSGELTPLAFKELVDQFDDAWLVQAFAAVTGGGDAKLRNRKLPAELTLWLVIGMALLRDRSIAAVVRHLDLVLPSSDGSTRISAGALPKARQRLGSGPLEVLFGLSATAWTEPDAQAFRWRGLSPWAIDGTCLDVPAGAENSAAFGHPLNAKTIGHHPQTRVVGLLQVDTHLLRALNVGGYEESEISLFRPLCDALPDNSLLLIDKGLQCRRTLQLLTRGGVNRHWLTRARANLACKPIKKLGRGDELVELQLPRDPEGRLPDASEATLVARRVRINRKGREASFLLTSCVDPVAFPADELRKQYVERWEIELAYDEVKNELLDSERVLRSKTPEGIRQEVYGVAIAYNLVRLQLVKAAKRRRVSPRQMSFRGAVLLVRNFLVSAWQLSPGNLPKAMARFERDLDALLLPQRRARGYPRHVIRRRWRYRARPPHRRPRKRTTK